MDHRERIRQEFTRQAATFSAAPSLNEAALTERFLAAMGEAAGGLVLDLACGPGILASALGGRARAVVGFDLTPRMLAEARRRARAAGRDNVLFGEGDAARLPFADATFDGVLTRLSVHHLPSPPSVLKEMARVLAPGGVFVLADIVSSEDPAQSQLHNAIEVLRDPSHVRMLPASELRGLVGATGLVIEEATTWERPRELEEWFGIANDPVRTAPLRTLLGALARHGESAGIDLALQGGKVVFCHRWLMFRARKP